MRGDVVFAHCFFSVTTQLKNNNQRVNVKNAAKQGYTKIRGVSCSSNLIRTKKSRAATVRSMPIAPHNIHEGKNEPRILKDGAREHPAIGTKAATAAIMAMDWKLNELNFLITLRFFCMMKQIPCLEGQGGNSCQQLGARTHVGSTRCGQSTLCGDYIDLAANAEIVRL